MGRRVVGRRFCSVEALTEACRGGAVARRYLQQISVGVASEAAVGVGIGEVEPVEFAVVGLGLKVGAVRAER